jgi:coiled-coil domain-containing protein 130
MILVKRKKTFFTSNKSQKHHLHTLAKAMAERKASNRYYPPEFWDDPKFSDKSNLNSFRGEGWRNRGAQVNSKLLTQGRDVIRFETPFDIWCEGCNQVIHKGVRFNSDKKKVQTLHMPCS